MKVYVVYYVDDYYDEPAMVNIAGVFSTKKKAKKYINDFNTTQPYMFEIEEQEVDLYD